MIDDTHFFVQVVESNGFSKAARELGCSASVVTRRIARLENELGVKLLQRNTRHIALTEAGAIFYESCRDVLQHHATAIKQIKNLSACLVGTLKIGLPVSISHIHIVPVLRLFLRKYPDLRIQIITGNHLVDLLSCGFDLIMHCGEMPNTNFYFKKLGMWSKITCATPEYFDQHGIPMHPNDLHQHNCLDHLDNANRTWRYLENNKDIWISVTGNIQVNSSLDLKTAALSGLGISYLPSFTVKDELLSGELKSVLEDYQPKKLGMYLVYPSKQYLSAKAKIFIDFLLSLNIADTI